MNKFMGKKTSNGGWSRAFLSVLLVLAMLFAAAVPNGLVATKAYADEDEIPAHSKTATENGDGTITLELSVTGDADTDVQTAANVNVLIVYDTSSSMTSNNVSGNRNRADYAEDVVHDFIENLRGYQNASDPSNIQAALVTFGPRADRRQDWTSDLTSGANGINRFFDDGVDGTITNSGVNSHNYNSNNGTNWDAALQQAQIYLNSADSDPTFVILVTDGACTASGNGNNAINPAGQPWTNFVPFYEAAREEAYAIQSAENVTLFGIYAYGTEADLLDDLIYYSNTGSDRSGYNGDTVETENYFSAGDTDQLNAAIESIFQKIVKALGISSAAIKDGTTSQVQTSTGEVSELLEVDESSYKYWLTIPIDENNQFQRIDTVSGDPVTYTVSSDGSTVTWPTSNSVTVDGEIISEGGKRYLRYQWTESNALYEKTPPEAKLNGASVDWDLSTVDTLLDGVTYSVTFTVYPSQTTLDIVADIKNDPGEDGAWSKLDKNIQKYITVDGELSTNTTATLSYVDTRTGESGEKIYDNPDPVESTAVEQLAVTKEWENEIDSREQPPVTLIVTRDDKETYTVTLSKDNTPDPWTEKVFISIGIMGADGKPLKGSEGHDFTFIEPEEGSGVTFYWELNVPVVHPMLIDGQPTMLVKVDEKHPLPDGATKYEFNDYKGNLSTYYVDEEIASLKAVNERRSRLYLKKEVTGENVPEDAIFPFTLNVVNPNAPAEEPADDPEHASDYWIWISARDKDGNALEVENATAASGTWWYAPSGTDITVKGKAGCSIMVNNLPTGTEYTFTEGEMADGFIFVKSELSIKGDGTDSTFEGDRVTKGTIESTNSEYTVTYTNEYAVVDVTVDKVWDDDSDRDGIRPETLALTLNGVTGTTYPDPTVTKSTDGNTWTYTWTGLAKYDADKEEISYTVSEDTVPEGYDCTGSPASDGGTITNKHDIETVDITVIKKWDDSEDIIGIRPDSITVQLTAGGENCGDPKELSDDNEWTWTWEGLPKNADGEAIVYAVDEVEVPAGYTKQDVVKEETDAGYAFTITNSFSPTPVVVDPPVQKIIEGTDALYNKGNFTFTIECTEYPEGIAEADVPMPENTSITNSPTYEKDGKPTYYEFGEIEFTVPGTYVYTVKESGSAPGVTNDKDAETGKTITFVVTADDEGVLSVSPTTDEVELSFTNVYTPEPTTAQIIATKSLTGKTLTEGQFSFTLTDDSTGKVVETVTNTAAGSIVFEEIEFTKGGTYTYTIAEVKGSEPGIVYDTNTIKATVTVTDDNEGHLSAVVKYDPAAAKFENKYEAKGSFTPEVTKQLEGRDLKAGEFSFTLTDSNNKVVETKTNAADGKVAFSALNYTLADDGKTFTYTIAEVKGSDKNTTYDEHTVTLTVKVTDNGDGTMKAEATYAGDQTFKNKYTPDTPKTGDVNRPILWIALAAAALIGIAVMLVLGRKKHSSGK